MTKTKIDKKRPVMRRRMSTAAILLSAIAFISSSALTNMDSISVLAAVPSNGSNNSASINQTSAHMLVQNLTKTNLPVTLPLTRGYVKELGPWDFKRVLLRQMWVIQPTVHYGEYKLQHGKIRPVLNS